MILQARHLVPHQDFPSISIGEFWNAVCLEEGLRLTAEWYKKEGYLWWFRKKSINRSRPRSG